MCGIVGAIQKEHAPTSISRGLYALQHRGHDGCGVAWMHENGRQLSVTSGKGAVADVLPDEKTKQMPSELAIGQNLYTTFGDQHSVQPFGGSFYDQDKVLHHLALVHNGQLCGIDKLRRKYPVVYRTHADSEIIFSLVPHMPGDTLKEKIFNLLNELEGAFSLLFILDDCMIAARDHFGFRPLILGEGPNGSKFFASEINAFDLMGAHFKREVKPGEMIVVPLKGEMESTRFRDPAPQLQQCVFEHIYFARPDNLLFGKPGYSTQIELGKEMAREMSGKVDADLVMAVPDSSTIATLGYSQESQVPYQIGLLRHHYAARTFITRGQRNREEAVRLKFNIVKDVIKGKRIILGDDSLVRSTTSKIVIQMLRDGGAKEVHLILFSPPIKHPCVYGINMASKNELIAARFDGDTEAISKAIGADSVNYLSLNGLKNVMGSDAENYCYACMDGNYPVQTDYQDQFSS